MWEHQGFKIELDGATFCTTINGESKAASSLAAAKKAIDKHLDADASVTAIDLPIVYLDSGKVMHATIDGIDMSLLRPTIGGRGIIYQTKLPA